MVYLSSDRVYPARERLGRRVKALRLERGLSQRKLAMAVGMNNSDLSKMEAGTANFLFDRLERIASALGVEVEDLFTD